MNTIQRLQNRLAPGARFVYESNTWHELLGADRWVGKTMTVKSGKRVKDVDVEGDSEGFRIKIPKTARQVEWLGNDWVRYQIVGKHHHYTTLRFLPSSAPEATTGSGVSSSDRTTTVSTFPSAA
jgi:hypothetical protein